MKRWPTKPLGDLVDFVGGGTPRRDRPDYWGGDIPWASVKDLQSQSLETTIESITAEGLANSASNLIPKGTVIIASRVGLGKVAINRKPVAINQDLKALTPRGDVLLPRYLLLFLLSNAEYFERAGVGATVKGLTIGDYQKLNIAVPPLAEQERIVKLLAEADELRKLRAQADRRTAPLLPALFHEMFGDPELNSRAMPVVCLGDLCATALNYGTMIPARVGEGKWLTLRVGNIQDGLLDLTDQKFVDLPDDMLERHTVKDGDLLLARAIGSKDHLGKCVVVNPGTRKWAFDSHLMRVRLNQQRCEPVWLKTLLDTPGGRRLFLNNTRQSAVQFNINSKEFAAITVPLPPLPLQKEFAERVAEIRAMEAVQAASRQRIESLFQSMLHRAFNGEL